jgi:hypothetical protein
MFADPLLAEIDAVIAERLAAQGGHDDEEALRLESSLLDFVEAAWPSIDGAEYQPNWAVDGLCEHLQAVAHGEIRRLLVNFPPRASKTTVASICFPAWLWTQRQRTFLKGPNQNLEGLIRLQPVDDDLEFQPAADPQPLVPAPVESAVQPAGGSGEQSQLCQLGRWGTHRHVRGRLAARRRRRPRAHRPWRPNTKSMPISIHAARRSTSSPG